MQTQSKKRFRIKFSVGPFFPHFRDGEFEGVDQPDAFEELFAKWPSAKVLEIREVAQ